MRSSRGLSGYLAGLGLLLLVLNQLATGPLTVVWIVGGACFTVGLLGSVLRA